jgi:hypothetical protein
VADEADAAFGHDPPTGVDTTAVDVDGGVCK